MNPLRKLFANQAATTNNPFESMAAEPAQVGEHQATQSNVIPLPILEPIDDFATGAQQSPKQPQVKGLIGSELIKAFFDQNHFGLGRHNGTNYRTIDAMEFGRSGRIAEFKNATQGTIDRMQAKIDRLASTELGVAGVCKATTAQLALAISQLERDIAVLKEQSDLAAEGKGWVLEALNRYQAGFVKGMREAVEAELIFG